MPRGIPKPRPLKEFNIPDGILDAANELAPNESPEALYHTKSRQTEHLARTDEMLNRLVKQCLSFTPGIKSVNDVLAIFKAQREFVGLTSQTGSITVNVVNVTVGALRKPVERADDIRKNGGKALSAKAQVIDAEVVANEPASPLHGDGKGESPLEAQGGGQEDRGAES